MIKKLFFIVISAYFGLNPLYSEAQVAIPKSAIQRNRTPKVNSNEFFSIVEADTLALSPSSENQYYGKRFGNGLLMAVRLNTLPEDSLSIYGMSVSFYGGRTDDQVELSTARIKALLWNEKDTLTSILPGNSNRSSANNDITVTAEEIRPVFFAFTDTSILIPKDFWIGIRYENAIDTINAISPIFNQAPNPFETLFYRTIVIDTLTTDTLRQTNTQFWQNPDLIGGLSGYILYKIKKSNSGVITTIDNPSKEIPVDLNLFAYPNPFNPQTTIQITTRETGQARLEIYNITGQRLVQKHLFLVQDSATLFQWEAKGIPSGIYFAKLIQNNSVKTVKLTLMK
jgi:hypothetical protein